MADLRLQLEADPGRESLVERLLHRRYRGDHPDEASARARAREAAERSAADLLRVVGPDGPCGHVWLAPDGDDVAVLDVTLIRSDLAPRVRTLVEQRARAAGARRVVFTCTPGDLVSKRFVEGGGYELVATQMRLDLGGDLPDEPHVELAPMSADRFQPWHDGLVAGYAEEQVAAGQTPDRARRDSAELVATLLPRGRDTEHQHLLVGLVAGVEVGVVWLGTERPLVFVYDVEVDPAQRGRGHGAGLVRAAALWARERGAPRIGLNVFGTNHVARSLYDRLGYLVTEFSVARVL